MCAFTEYKINIFNEGSNVYGVARCERWAMEVNDVFGTYQQAQQYVIEQSLQHTTLGSHLLQWKETPVEDRTVTREAVIDNFCFTNDDYLIHRRFIIEDASISAKDVVMRHFSRVKLHLAHSGVCVSFE
jgi:hypothetical protein